MSNAVPPTVLHVPHASTSIPADIRLQFVLNDKDLAREIDLITDHFTDDLFSTAPSDATELSFPVNRLVVDPERFPDDALEPMVARGMGVIYERTTHQAQLRRLLTPQERESLLERFYRPHHACLTAAVAAALQEHDRCLIIDAHSFPATPLPYELDQDVDRPDFCIGTDAYHTSAELAAKAVDYFEQRGFRVALNRPFAGALVPLAYYEKDPRVQSVMIEVNRGLYLDPPDRPRRSESFAAIREAIAGCVARLGKVR